MNNQHNLFDSARAEFLASEQGSAAVDNIARVCHEANRAFCQTLGDDSQAPWDEAPDWQKNSAKLGVRLHLSGDFDASASHENWMKEKLADGWKYGPVKIPAAKEHPCLVPFEKLDGKQQMKDHLFRAIVHAFRTEIEKGIT